MKSIFDFTGIFIHKLPVDMRKSINGLSAIVVEEMKLDLKSQSIFVFSNRRRTHMKILYFDRSGFALWLKRLESSRFSWPRDMNEDVIEIIADDMKLLLDGVNIWTRFKKVDFENIV